MAGGARPLEALTLEEVSSSSTIRKASDVELERTLFRKLLELTYERDVERLLESALKIMVDLASAEHGYLEIRDPYRPTEPKRAFTLGMKERGGPTFEEAISSGVIQDAIASGETIVTLSAMTDPRFEDRESVQRKEISAVLCAPIGRAPAFGVIYLEGRSSPGPFTEADRQRSELCASQIAALSDRLMLHRREDEQAQGGGALVAKLAAEGFVAQSPAIRRVLEQLDVAAPLDVSVLLTGPTGTGKSMLARALHGSSARALGPFVELNCAALPESLIESELFGWSRGAHSTASSARPGKVAAAEGGTLFLDEVAELSSTAQAKLLQLLHSKVYYSLGDNRPQRANIRVVAATHQDLKQRVRERTFREDLYYRLMVFPLHVPALDERPEDVGPLVRRCVERACAQYGWSTLPLSPQCLRALQRRSWPGNVRELENVVEAAAIRATAENAPQIEPRHVLEGVETTGEPLEETLHEGTRRFQQELLKRRLDEADWNVTTAAARLGVARSYLYKLIHAHQLRRD